MKLSVNLWHLHPALSAQAYEWRVLRRRVPNATDVWNGTLTLATHATPHKLKEVIGRGLQEWATRGRGGGEIRGTTGSKAQDGWVEEAKRGARVMSDAAAVVEGNTDAVNILWKPRSLLVFVSTKRQNSWSSTSKQCIFTVLWHLPGKKYLSFLVFNHVTFVKFYICKLLTLLFHVGEIIMTKESLLKFKTKYVN